MSFEGILIHPKTHKGIRQVVPDQHDIFLSCRSPLQRDLVDVVHPIEPPKNATFQHSQPQRPGEPRDAVGHIGASQQSTWHNVDGEVRGSAAEGVDERGDVLRAKVPSEEAEGRDVGDPGTAEFGVSRDCQGSCKFDLPIVVFLGYEPGRQCPAREAVRVACLGRGCRPRMIDRRAKSSSSSHESQSDELPVSVRLGASNMRARSPTTEGR